MRQFGRFGPLVGSVDESTSSARFMVFAANTSEMLTYHQIPIITQYPKEGWVEQDPMEILQTVLECIEITIDNLRKLDINPEDIVAVGIANQRETTIVWDFKTGNPLYNAIAWLDNRAADLVESLFAGGARVVGAVQASCGLPPSALFSGPKLRWLLDNVLAVKTAIKQGTCMAGTVDSWLIWNLTGGSNGGLHMTDVTNASRTMLLNLSRLQWDPALLSLLGIPRCILPTVRSCSEIYGYIVTGSLTGIPISGCLADQQAALVGQMCFEFGQAKCTFGAGAFLLYNTGKSIIKSKNGLITTVAYKLGPDAPATYALEGSVSVAGSALQWLQDGLDISEDCSLEPSPERGGAEGLVQRLGSGLLESDPGEVYFVPAFSGLYAPYWRKDARGVICGVTSSTTRQQLLKGALRGIGLQTRALLLALEEDIGRGSDRLLAGGAAATAQLMQAQADVCGIPLVRSVMAECSALGAAMAAGGARGIDVWPYHIPSPPSDTFLPTTSEDERAMMYVQWKMAVERSYGLGSQVLPSIKDEKTCDIKEQKIYSSIPGGIFLISSCLLMLVANKLNT